MRQHIEARLLDVDLRQITFHSSEGISVNCLDPIVLNEQPVDLDRAKGSGGQVWDVVVLQDEDVHHVHSRPDVLHCLKDPPHHAVDTPEMEKDKKAEKKAKNKQVGVQ